MMIKVMIMMIEQCYITLSAGDIALNSCFYQALLLLFSCLSVGISLCTSVSLSENPLLRSVSKSPLVVHPNPASLSSRWCKEAVGQS